jgi:hypothetical protein
MKSKISLLAIFLFGATAGYGQWRPVTAEEEAFLQPVEVKVKKILSTAAHKIPGKWGIKIETDQFQRHELDEGQHHGRPHEVRIRLIMDYQPTDAEVAQMDKEIFAHAEQTKNYDPIPDELNRINPERRLNIFVSLVVNYYGFQPVFPADIPGLGYETTTPGAFYSFVRWKHMGIGAPKSVIYLGQFKRLQTKDGPKIVEDFSTVADCRDAKTAIVEVQSSERLIEKFIAVLDVEALNTLFREH